MRGCLCNAFTPCAMLEKQREKNDGRSTTTEDNCVSSTGPRGERRDVNGLVERLIAAWASGPNGIQEILFGA